MGIGGERRLGVDHPRAHPQRGRRESGTARSDFGGEGRRVPFRRRADCFGGDQVLPVRESGYASAASEGTA